MSGVRTPPPDQLKVGIHSLGYVAESTQEAVNDFFPGYAHTMTEIGKERGWPKMTRASFDAQPSQQGSTYRRSRSGS